MSRMARWLERAGDRMRIYCESPVSEADGIVRTRLLFLVIERKRKGAGA